MGGNWCYNDDNWLEDYVPYTETANRLKIMRVESWREKKTITINGVDANSDHDDVCVDTVNSNNFNNGWIISIEGHDALWIDRFRVTKTGGCSGSFLWGTSNDYGWCLSTDPNDWEGFKKWWNNCGQVPERTCYRTRYLSDNGYVYYYLDRNYSLFGRRRLEGISYEDLLRKENGKFYHVDKNGNAVGQAVDDGFNIVPSPVTPAPTPGSTSRLTCKEISNLPGLHPQVLCAQCGATGYCKAKYKKRQNKCTCKQLKCKKCKKDQACCRTNPEGCTWNATAKRPCS